MATVTNRLAFLISANADQAIRAFDKTAIAADKQLGKASKSIDKLGGSLTKFGAAGLAAAGTLGAGLYSMAQGAIEDQRAQALLAQQLKNSTGATQEQIAEVEKMIDLMARASGIADDQLRPAYSNLVRATGSMTRSTKLLNLAMDISRATGRDLSAVTIGLGRAANGQFGALSRLGIPLDEATKKSKDFNKVLDILTKQFGGQASAYAETYAGKMERTKVAVDEAKEAIGTGFVPIIENVSNALTKGATGFSKLDTATGGAVGSFASYGVAALGVVSATSLVAGQIIKFRGNLMDADGELNKLGKTAKTASILIGGIAIAQGAAKAILELGGASRETDKRLNTLLTTLGQGDAAKETTTAFAELADQLKNADTGVTAFYKQFGKAIRIAGADTDAGRIAIEYLDEAFSTIAAKSPALGQKIVDALYQQSLALDKTGATYKDNMMLVARYQTQLNGLKGATEAVTKAETDAAAADAKAAAAKEAAEKRAKSLADAQQKLKDKVVSSANAVRTDLGQALEVAKTNLKKATEEFNNYRNSISSSITGTIGFGSAQGTAAKNVEDLKSATTAVAEAQDEYNKLLADKDADPDSKADAFKRLAEAQKQLTAAQATPKTFIDSLKAQETSAKSFATNIQSLLNLGAKQGLIDQLAASGAEAGNAIASEILSSANPAAYVDQVNGIISNTQSIADKVGTSAAEKFKKAGVDSATALLNGMNDVLSKAQIKLKFSNLNKKGTPIKTLKDLTDRLQNSITGLFTVGGFATDDIPQLAQGGIVKASPGGTLALLGEGGRNEAVIPLPDKGGLGGQNVYITVQTGVGDPVAIGAALVDVLQKYQSRTGSLPLKVR